jgi:hypothetical protein
MNSSSSKGLQRTDSERTSPGPGTVAEPDDDPVDAERVFFPPRSVPARVRAAAAAIAHAPQIWRIAGDAHAVHGGSRLATVRRLHRLRARGWAYSEALREGVLDPAIRDQDLAGYPSRHVALTAQRAVNPGSFTDLTTEKAVFYRYCAALGLPVPQMLAIVHRDTAGWGIGDVPLATATDLARVLEAHPVDIVVKPSDGGQGVYVRVFRNEGGDFWDDSDPHTVADLWRMMRTHPEHPCFVVQERLRNHRSLTDLVPSRALNTIRLVLFQPLEGPPEVTQAVIRLGLGGAATDNYGDGSVGNGYCEIDPATGRLGPLRTAGPGGASLVDHATLPGSGTRIEGVELPMWAEALELARAAMPHVLPNRSIGWDVAITDRGPVIVEANREWTPFPQPILLAALARTARA